MFEPPDLWQTHIDATFRERAPRIDRIESADQIVVEADQFLFGIGLISKTGVRFEAPETISAQGTSKTCAVAGTILGNTSRTWRSMGWRVKSSIPRKSSCTSRWRAPLLMVRDLSRVQLLTRRPRNAAGRPSGRCPTPSAFACATSSASTT